MIPPPALALSHLPERRTLAGAPGIGGARIRRGRRRVDAGRQKGAFVFEGPALRLQCLAFAVKRDAALRKTQIGLLLCYLQNVSRRVLAV